MNSPTKKNTPLLERINHLNWLVDKGAKSLSNPEFKVLMVYFRHAYPQLVEVDGQKVHCDFVRITDKKVGESIGKSMFTVRDIRKKLIARGLMMPTKNAGYGYGVEYELANKHTRKRIQESCKNNTETSLAGTSAAPDHNSTESPASTSSTTTQSNTSAKAST